MNEFTKELEDVKLMLKHRLDINWEPIYALFYHMTKNILELESPDLFKTDDDTTINLDQVFKTIIAIYNKKILLIVISTLKLIEEEKDELHRNEYYEGLQKILAPTNARIRAWIREKLTC